MNKVKLSECKLNLEKLQNIICIWVFGSYNEECFDKNRSDIDIIYKYKKERLEEKFTESKIFLVKIRECLERSPNSEDEIVDEAMISYFNSFCEFIIDMCDTYLVSTDNFIPNKSGPEIVELSSTFGFISSEDSKKLQNILRLRNRYTHDYYQRKKSRQRILDICRKEMKTLDLFLDISTEKIMLIVRKIK